MGDAWSWQTDPLEGAKSTGGIGGAAPQTLAERLYGAAQDTDEAMPLTSSVLALADTLGAVLQDEEAQRAAARATRQAARAHAEKARAASERVRRQLHVEELQAEERRRQREQAAAVARLTADYARMLSNPLRFFGETCFVQARERPTPTHSTRDPHATHTRDPQHARDPCLTPESRTRACWNMRLPPLTVRRLCRRF